MHDLSDMFRAFSPLFCFESHYLALQARLVCYAPLALRKSHAVGGVSSYGKELAPLGAPSANSAFFCRLPRWPSGGRRPCTVGAEGVETVIGEYVRRGYRS